MAEGRLSKEMLGANDAFLVSTGDIVYVWVGQKASKEERAQSMCHAASVAQSPNTQVTHSLT